MKKFILIGGVVYVVISLGFGVYFLANPDKYGEWLGRYVNGFTRALEKED